MDEISICISTLQLLVRGRDDGLDSAAVRRAVNEARQAWPGETDELWWKWLCEAGMSLGLRMRAIDSDFDEIIDLVAHESPVALRTPDGEWLVVIEKRRSRLKISGSSDDDVWINHKVLNERLGSPADGELLRCVIAHPAQSCVEEEDIGHGHGSEHELTPFARLRVLLRPEWTDIWIVLLFAMLVGLLTLAIPIAVETMVSTVAFGRLLQPLVLLVILLFIFLLFAGASRVLQTWVVEIIQRRLFVRVAADVAYRLPRVRHKAFDGVHPPELVNRFFDVITVQKVTSSLLLDGLALVLQVFTGMIVLAFYHPWLLGFDVFLLLALAFVVFVLGKGAVKTSVAASKTKYRLAGWLQGLARCSTTFKLDGGTEFAAECADRMSIDYLKARRRRFRILMRQVLALLLLQAVASTVLLALGGWLVIQRQMTLGQLVAAELIVTLIVSSLAKLGKHLESFYDLLAAVDKLGVLFDLPSERQDGLQHIGSDQGARVRLQDVSYRYADHRRGLNSISLTVDPGERIALAGPSGTGMSTLLDLLYGLRHSATGHIEIDGTDPRDLRPDALRRHVALVRFVEIFDGTIAENIHMERSNISAGDVRTALERVGLLEAVLALPDGLETRLNSRGRPLSASESRRLVLARALAGQPRLLLIDGLFDSLGDDDLQSLLTALFDGDRDCSMIIVSRRDRVRQRCDWYFDLSTGTRMFEEDAGSGTPADEEETT